MYFDTSVGSICVGFFVYVICKTANYIKKKSSFSNDQKTLILFALVYGVLTLWVSYIASIIFK
jgi:hypothetical protein